MNINGAAAAIKAFKEALSDNVVTPSEIVKRVLVCKACPKLKRDTGMQTAVSRLLGNLANKHRLPDEIKGKSCGVCGCSLMLLVPANEKDLHVDNAQETKIRPKTCWIYDNKK